MKQNISSTKISKSFYKNLSISGMLTLTSSERDLSYVKFLTKILPKHEKILDCACGYGRLTIPLFKNGFIIKGIDLSSNLIKFARSKAKQEKLNINFKIGNMCKLPYKDNSFKTVICMWSSFIHLLTEKDQLNALREMIRVTNKNGLILIDLPKPTSKKNLKQLGTFLDKDCKLYQTTLNGVENIVYLHNKKTIYSLL